MILYMDSSTVGVSATLAKGAEILASRSISDAQGDATKKLGLLVDEMLGALPKGAQISGIATTDGPGSYTGLRISASLSKGLAMGYGVPLYAVSSLEVMAQRAVQELNLTPEAKLIPMIDARRMEVYKAEYTAALQLEAAPEAEILAEETYRERIAKGEKLVLLGNGAAKCQPWQLEGLEIYPEIMPLSVAMIPSVLALIEKGEAVDLAYWQPNYLKEYKVQVSTNKVLGK